MHLQTSCADTTAMETSIVFVYCGSRGEPRLQKMKQSTSAGIGLRYHHDAIGALPKWLGVVRRETIQDPNFYNSFFVLVQGYVAQDGQSHMEHDADMPKQGDQRASKASR